MRVLNRVLMCNTEQHDSFGVVDMVLMVFLFDFIKHLIIKTAHQHLAQGNSFIYLHHNRIS